MTKILTVTPFFPPDIGGISTHVFNLNHSLLNHGHDIKVISARHLGNKYSEQYNNFSQITRLNSIFLPGWPYPTLRNFSFPIDLGTKIDSIIKNGDFDIVHAHGHHYPISWKAITSAYKYDIPCILTLHGMYALNPNVVGGNSWLEDIFNKFVFRKILSKTTAVIGQTEVIVNYAKKYGKESTKYFIIPNGVNTSLFRDNLKRKISQCWIGPTRKKYGI